MKSFVLEGFSKYTIYENGTIYGAFNNSYMKTHINSRGYPYLTLTSDNGEKKGFTLHRLLAIGFIDNPENLPQVNHKNKIKTDFSIDNLEWISARDNVVHSLAFDQKLARVIDTKCYRCGKPLFIKEYKLYNINFCNRQCQQGTNIDKFLSLGSMFIEWSISNYPMSYIASICECSDVGIKKRLVKLGFNISRKQLLPHRPSSLEELFNYYKNVVVA